MTPSTPPVKQKQGCASCSRVLPGGWIEVDDVRNPHCSDCGRPILSSDLPLVVRYKSPVKQTQEWEKRFDAKFVMDNGVEWKGKNGQWAGEDGPDIDAIKDFIASQKKEMVEKIRVAERRVLDKSYKKYGVLNYDYNNGVFEMRFELEDILSALEKEGEI